MNRKIQQTIVEVWMMHRGGGGTHIFGWTGMCCPNGSLFYKKPLNISPVFTQKILKHGSTFLTEPQIMWFSGFFTLKIAEFLKNRPIFEGKSLKMGTLFAKIALKDGYGFWGSSSTPTVQLKSEYPPGMMHLWSMVLPLFRLGHGPSSFFDPLWITVINYLHHFVFKNYVNCPYSTYNNIITGGVAFTSYRSMHKLYFW